MTFFNPLAAVLRWRSTLPATGAASLTVDATSAAMSSGAMESGALPATGAPETGIPMVEEMREPSPQEKRLMLHLSNVSHGVNHFQNQMMTMLWPSIMAELGMSYTQVGVLSAITSVLNSICQGVY